MGIIALLVFMFRLGQQLQNDVGVNQNHLRAELVGLD